MTHESTLFLRTARPFAILFFVATLFVSLPLAAQEDDDPLKRHRVITIDSLGGLEALEGLEGLAGLGGLQALRIFDCDDGEDCPSFFSLGATGGFLGVQASSINGDLREHFGAPANAGVLVAKVVEGSPAEAAGVIVGDVIIAVNGESVHGSGQLGNLIRKIEAETPADIEVIRDHRALVLTATIQERERTTIDLADVIDQSMADALQSFDPSILNNALAEIDFKGIANLGVGTLDAEGFEEALGAISETFDSDAWQGFVTKLENLDFSELEARMEELQERMEELGEELERKREERRRR
jgi:membrane-associated protease RseP (regulator of RpoE activity)